MNTTRQMTIAVLVVAAIAPGIIQSAQTPQPQEATAQWPRFRGPNANPVSEHPGLPLSWSKTENVEWVADVPGVGWSSPVVWGNRVFLTAATSDKPMKQPSLGVDYSNEYLAELRKQGLSAEEINRKLYERDREMPDELVISLVLYCYDLESGQRLWERQMYKGRPAGGRHAKNSFASETPTTDGERVYVYLTGYGLFGYDFAGNQSWATPLKPHATTRDWGTGASAALHDDRLFVLNDNEEQSFVAAFDTRTGTELWRTPRTVQPARKTGWSTPFVWENRVRTELVTLGPGVAISYSLDGRELWRMNRMGGYAIQSPFAWKDLLFVTSGAGGDTHRPIAAVRAGGSGDITPPGDETTSDHVVWYDGRAGGTYLPTPVIYKDALYVLNDKGIFARYDPRTGERSYQSRVAPGAAAFTASPWAYNGHVFVLSEEGDTFVIEAADQYRLIRVNTLDDFSMATPAIVGDRLLIRTQHRLYSIRNR
jgi:outer membrane protein assembly factor BamB